MRTTLITAACIALAGCSAMTPMPDVQPQLGKTAQEQETARSECRSIALSKIRAPEFYAGAAVTGLSVVGHPAYVVYLRETQRGFFKDCMAERGYAVVQ